MIKLHSIFTRKSSFAGVAFIGAEGKTPLTLTVFQNKQTSTLAFAFALLLLLSILSSLFFLFKST